MDAKDFGIIFLAYIIIKVGYMVSYNSLFHLLSLKAKKIEGTYIDKFTKTLGFALIFLGLTTGSIIVFKRYIPNYYMHGYILVIFATVAFLIIKLNSYKNSEKELMNNGS